MVDRPSGVLDKPISRGALMRFRYQIPIVLLAGLSPNITTRALLPLSTEFLL
jgi:hypothetical protein